ncbi:hypothetical protein IWQ62_002320, partial [Dispira parvispora]
MKASILGWGVLTYLLARSPGLLANKNPVCEELQRELTSEELQSPRGLIAKIACYSLRTEPTPLKAIEEIQLLNHDELFGSHFNGYYYSGENFVRPTAGLPKDTVKQQWIDLQQLSSKELLDFSPMFFLTRHDRPVEALILIGELSARSKDVDFVVAFNHALGVVTETYPMYFANDRRYDRLSSNLSEAVSYIFRPNVYLYVLSTRNQKVISNLINGLDEIHKLKDELPKLEKLSQRVPNFKNVVITRPGRNSGLVIGWTNSVKHHQRGGYSPGADAYLRDCDRFFGMVAEFQAPVMRYANVT